MRIIDCEQGSPEWIHCRLGIPTASHFAELVTPKTLKPSASSRRYLRELLAEYMLGEPVDQGASQWMERGTALEVEARRWYEFDRGVEVRTVGFVQTNDGLCGCSPDGMVNDDGLLEIKNPSAVVHVGYMLEPEALVDEYRAQVQGQLWVCEREWCDLLSYTPATRGLEPVVVRVEYDPAWGDALTLAVYDIMERRDEALRRFGYMQAAAEAVR